MHRVIRILMALSVVIVLVPTAAAVVTGEAISDLWPWDSDAQRQPSLMANLRKAEPRPHEDERTVRGVSDLTCAPPGCAQAEGKRGVGSQLPHKDGPNSTAQPGSGETTSDSEGATESEPTTTKAEVTVTTSGGSETDSTLAFTTTTSTDTQFVGDVISGEACPCTVTGTVELKGTIELRGDLIVKGGLLVARPGVELNGNGYQIMFMEGGRADFQGSKTSTWSGRGANQNLNRDVTFRNLRRIMWMNGAGKSIVKYVTVSDSGTPSLGDYPLHWHRNGNSTRGTIVEGVVVINGAHHAYVPHGSHGITFRDVIAKNTTDEAIWWDLPDAGCNESRSRHCTFNNSNDTVFDRVLVDGVKSGGGPGDGLHNMAGFVLGAGAGNVVRDSVAINVTGGSDCSGFHWPARAAQNDGGTIWTFKNNYAQSPNCHGIFVWQNDGDRHHIIDGFSGDSIDHGAYGNSYEYRNLDVPVVEAHAGGWSITSGRIGTLSLHTPGPTSPNDPTVAVSNTQVGRLIVDNKSKNGREKPPRYEFVNIGLTCSDVEYVSLETGTEIVIDGATCSP